MAIKDKLYDELVRICKESDAVKISKPYYELCRSSLSHYSSPISTQSDFFYEQFVYAVDEDKKIIYMERGWQKGAHQLLLDFVHNDFRYDTYQMPEDFYLGNPAYRNRDDWWEDWVNKNEKIIEDDIFACLEAFDKTEARKMLGSQVFNIDRTQFEIKDISKDSVSEWLAVLLRDMFLDGRKEFETDFAENILLSVEPVISGDVAKAYQTMLTHIQDEKDWEHFLTGLSGSEPFSVSFKVISPDLVPDVSSFNELVDKVYSAQLLLRNIGQGDFFLGGFE